MNTWDQVRKICKRIDSDYDPENNLGKPLVTNIDIELKDAALLLADYCEALDERIRELETNAAIRRQAEEDARDKTMTQPMIALPLGWLAGHPVAIDAALQHMSTEILAHAADLEANPATASQVPVLRRYGVALWLIYWQLLTPEQKANTHVDRAAMAGLAAEHKLNLPDDLRLP